MNQHAAAAHRRRPNERPRIREAALGLLCERPSSAPALSIRLRERLRAADFPDNYVYWVLEGLEREGLVTRIAPQQSVAAEGDASGGARNARYQATASGVEHFKQWLVSPSIEPALRDELMVRIAFCGPTEVPRLIELVYSQEQACLGRVEDLKTTAEQAQTNASQAGEAEWQQMLRTMGRDAELAHWSARVEWLQSVREMLEELARKSGLR